MTFPPENATPAGGWQDFRGDMDAELYAELRRLASRRLGRPIGSQTLQPTALVHEAWLRLAGAKTEWRDRGHFMATAVTAMRHILIDGARRKASQRNGGALRRTEALTMSDLASPKSDETILLIDEGIAELERVDPTAASIVVARFFGGLSIGEIAVNLGISDRSVHRRWVSARVWLFRWLQEARNA